MAKVFTLPDVEVGSIIEYRYALRYDDNYFIPPDWFIQSDLFLRKGRYIWKPTNQQLLTSQQQRPRATHQLDRLVSGAACRHRGQADPPSLHRLTTKAS